MYAQNVGRDRCTFKSNGNASRAVFRRIMLEIKIWFLLGLSMVKISFVTFFDLKQKWQRTLSGNQSINNHNSTNYSSLSRQEPESNHFPFSQHLPVSFGNLRRACDKPKNSCSLLINSSWTQIR